MADMTVEDLKAMLEKNGINISKTPVESSWWDRHSGKVYCGVAIAAGVGLGYFLGMKFGEKAIESALALAESTGEAVLTVGEKVVENPEVVEKTTKIFFA